MVRPFSCLPGAPIDDAITSRRVHCAPAGMLEIRVCAVALSMRSSPHDVRYSVVPSDQAKRISRGGLHGLISTYATRLLLEVVVSVVVAPENDHWRSPLPAGICSDCVPPANCEVLNAPVPLTVAPAGAASSTQSVDGADDEGAVTVDIAAHAVSESVADCVAP